MFAADVGFQDFVVRKPTDGSRALLNSRALVDDAIAWLRANHDARFYLYLHVLRPHNPYLPPDEFAQRFRPASYRGTLVPDTDLLVAVDTGARHLAPDELDFVVSQYDTNLAYGDRLVGDLVRSLAELGVLDRTVVVVMADHGEAFGQHGRFLHNTTVYEEMVHVPLVIRFPPGARPRARRVSEPVALVDLFPTLADLFSLTRAKAIPTDGVSLVPALERSPVAPRRLIFARAGSLVSAIDASYHYIALFGREPTAPPVREELYYLPDDPEERRNLSALHKDRTRAMREVVMRMVDGRIPPQTLESTLQGLDEEKRRELRALGYVQ